MPNHTGNNHLIEKTKPALFIALTLILSSIILLLFFSASLAAPVSSSAVHKGPVPPIVSGYGAWGSPNVITTSFQFLTSPGYTNTVTIYHAVTQTRPAPAVFFAPGWNVPCEDYGQLLCFLAGKGYAVACDDYQEDTSEIGIQLNESFSHTVSIYKSIFETDHFGVIGHSSGAGLLPSLVYDFIRNKHWGGANGEHAFILEAAPWFDFDTTDAKLADYPAKVKLLLLVGENDQSTDWRTYVDQFESIPIPDTEKDFIILRESTVQTYTYTASHPIIASGNQSGYGVYDAMDDYGVFRLVDALADYTFHGNNSAKPTALGDGRETQIEMGSLRDLISTDDPRPIPGQTYDYPCNADINPRKSHCADYDHELPGAVLITPTKHIHISKAAPIFRWEPVPTANQYFLQIRPLLPNGEPNWNISFGESVSAADASCTAGAQSCSHAIANSLPAGEYVWWIKGYSNTLASVWSRRGYFSELGFVYLPFIGGH